MSDEDTLPPKRPQTWLRGAQPYVDAFWAWAGRHRDYTIPAAAFLLGCVVGKLL